MISPTPEVGSISNLLNCTRSIGSPKVANDNLSNGPSAIKQSSVSVSTTVTSTASGLDNIDSQPVVFGSDKPVTNQNEPPAPQVSIAFITNITFVKDNFYQRLQITIMGFINILMNGLSL